MVHLLILNTTLLMPFSRFYSLLRVQRGICCREHEHEISVGGRKEEESCTDVDAPSGIQTSTHVGIYSKSN